LVAGSNPAFPATYGEVAQFGRATKNVYPVFINKSMRNLINIVDETDLSRRGFLKGASGALASAAIPGGATGEAIKALTAVPLSSLKVLNDMLKVANIDTIYGVVNWYLDTDIDGFLTDEMVEVLNQNAAKAGFEDWPEFYHAINNNLGDDQNNSVKAISMALGRPHPALAIENVLNKHGIKSFNQTYDFWFDGEVFEAMETAWDAAKNIVQIKAEPKATAEPEVAAGEESAAAETEVTTTVRGFIQRALGILSNKLMPDQTKTAEPEIEPVEEPKALPAPTVDPSANELDRIQTLSGIKSEK
jgi:hypothetical protein